ncbi:MAG: ABC transporter permease [Oscillospiraceae bacterium]|nr:ABC transporter permease [Oscillospiraceae bacterium]
MSDLTKNLDHVDNTEEFEVLEEAALPKVDEFKRFVRVFFRRKIVTFSFCLLIIIVLVAVFADFVAPHGFNEHNLRYTLQPPSAEFLLGTDGLGRCLLSRIIYGSRIALLVGIAAVAIAATIGTVIGLIAGFSEGIVGGFIMRVTDAVISIPPLVLMLLIATIIGAGVPGVIIAVGVATFPGYVRLIYGQVLTVKQNDYITASRAMGDTKARIIFKHILPNCISPLIVMMTMMIGTSIMIEAGLSFLGIGIVPPTPAWGSMTRDGYQHLASMPLLSIAPGIAIVILVFACNMVGDGIRDALDPKLRGSLD